MIDEQDTVEMVDLMLDAGCEKSFHILFANLVLAVEIPDAHPFVPLHLGEMLRQ
jgi:hypothetical protein